MREFELEDGRTLRFETVALMEDDEGNAYAVCYNQDDDQYAVTDQYGDLLDDQELAQEILDDFLVFHEESGPPEERA